MPGGQGGGGSAPPIAGETSSISGRNANTTVDTALRCSHGFIGHLFCGGVCMEILGLLRWPGGSNGADGCAMLDEVQHNFARFGDSTMQCYLQHGGYTGVLR